MSMQYLNSRLDAPSVTECRLRCEEVPFPRHGERPVAYADRVGEWYVALKSDRQRKDQGLFLTPILVADFMGQQIAAEGRMLRILDPAAGAGVLCCAAVEALMSRPSPPDEIDLVAYEVDPDLIAPLQATLDYLATWCLERFHVRVGVHLEATDFILANAQALPPHGFFLPRQEVKGFDLIIANPPYFKIGKGDTRAVAVAAVVHGQPNIYALFMAVGASLLRKGGDFIFLTPRSFASGHYFRRFRASFFNMIQPSRIHVFRSRREVFRRDAVLHENVIITGVRQDNWYEDPAARVTISSSWGVVDIKQPDVHEVAARTALDSASIDKNLRMPVCDGDNEALSLVDSWPSSLAELGLNISTGPVVPFRATDLIAREGEVPATHVPLLWMNHVRAMRATWPLERHKPEYIVRRGAEPSLVPNKNYVLVRRFSSKEEPRRLIAAPWTAAEFAIPELGLENHLNYIHCPGGTLSEDEALGLAALYNSRLLDTWFRAINGNTQVSASELRTMPLPARDVIIALGRRVKHLDGAIAQVDELVASTVARPG